MIDHYFYSGQLRKYQVQFGAIFSGLQVKFGKDADGVAKLISVPIHYASPDKVVAALYSGNTNNKPIQLPMLSFYLSGIELSPERRKGVGLTHRRTVLKAGGVYPDDLQVVARYMPIPYTLNLDLFMYASNTDQLQQIKEQIMMLFDPTLQIQTSDEEFDWTKLTQVEMVGFNNEENFPAGGDRRILQWSANFRVPIWISPPMDVKNDYVASVKLRIWDGVGFNIDELDVDGNPVPFAGEVLGETSTDIPLTLP